MGNSSRWVGAWQSDPFFWGIGAGTWGGGHRDPRTSEGESQGGANWLTFSAWYITATLLFFLPNSPCRCTTNPGREQVISGDPRHSSLLLLGSSGGCAGDVMVTGRPGAKRLAAAGRMPELTAEMS